MKTLLLMVLTIGLLGCANHPSVKRANAYDTRVKEIDAAFVRGDITEVQRQELKNDALKVLSRQR